MGWWVTILGMVWMTISGVTVLGMVGDHPWQLLPSLSFVSNIQDNAGLISISYKIFGGLSYLHTVAICRGVFAPKNIS